MKKILFTLTFAASALSCSFAAHASGVDSLENFMKNAKTGRADFTQVVTSPPRDGQASKSKTSTGSFEFARPSKFRFTYKKPFEQTIVADGQTLWLYDADLRQVTKRAQAQVLAQTPAAIISAAPDLATLRRDFTVEAAGEKDGIEWVQATPKNREGQVHSIKVGFRGSELAALDILDGFGQRSVMTFSKMEMNAKVGSEAFDFKPPQNADVVKQ